MNQIYAHRPEDRINMRLKPEDRQRITLIAQALARKAGGRKPTLTETLRIAIKMTAACWRADGGVLTS